MTPEQLAQLIKDYGAGLASDPRTAAYTANNGTEAFVNAYLNNDFSNIKGPTGQPFNLADQTAAEAKGWADVEGAFKAQKDYEQKQAEAQLAQKQADYQNYLVTQGQQFQKDKSALDQTAAEQGVLFSGGRRQRENSLANTYSQNLQYKQDTMGRDISQTANDFNYKYGNEAAKGLSKYYNLGGQTYNPGVATGGVASTGLSSVYNATNPLYQGTVTNQYKAAGQQRAAASLANKGYKLLGAYQQ